MKKPIVIYHGGCTDGFAAAWAVWRKHRDWEFYPGVYQTPPPDVTGREVYLVDFSYKRDVLLEMAARATEITVIDHHKSAQADLVDMPHNVRTVFDMNRCGCVLTWEHFHPDTDMPELMLDIQDRDLWIKERLYSDEIIMAIRSYPLQFKIWSTLMSEWERASLIDQGKHIARYYNRQVGDLLAAWARSPVWSDIGGYLVPVVNANFQFASELAGRLAEAEHFAAVFWHTSRGVTYSLRSRADGVDVAAIAEKYGGGGHRGAAGFRREQPLPMVTDGEVVAA